MSSLDQKFRQKRFNFFLKLEINNFIYLLPDSRLQMQYLSVLKIKSRWNLYHTYQVSIIIITINYKLSSTARIVSLRDHQVIPL